MAENAHSEHPAECRNVWQKWGGYLDKELSVEESSRVQRHLDECGHCREFVETQTSFNRLLRKSLVAESEALPETLRVKVLSLLERKSEGLLSQDEERSLMSGSHRGHDHGHSHGHGEPGHVHDHSHPHSHSHGMSPTARALLAVLSVGLVLVALMALVQRNKNDVLTEKVATLEKQAVEAKSRDADLAQLRKLLNDAKGERTAAEMERDELRRENKELQRKYDESVVAAEKLQKALSALVNAGSAVMKLNDPMKPVPELEKKWRDMFPQIGDMPHKAGDMDPTLWDVTPIEGEDVLWVVFTKKGDPQTRFTLMTFTENYVRKHFGELKDMAETVKNGMTVCAWPNARKNSGVYHALISTSDLHTTREQLRSLK